MKITNLFAGLALLCLVGSMIFVSGEVSQISEIEITTLGSDSKPELRTMQSNTTSSTTYLFNGQTVKASYIAPYGWNYYYITLKANSELTITHSCNSYNTNLEVYAQKYTLPTVYSYQNKHYMTTSPTAMKIYNSDYSSSGVYIAVRNARSYAEVDTRYSFTVNVVNNNNNNDNSGNNNNSDRYNGPSVTPFLGMIVSSFIFVILLVVIIIIQIRRINRLNERITALERTVSPNQTLTTNDTVPLVSSNTLEQETEVDHEAGNVVQPQPQPVMYPVFPQPQQYSRPFVLPPGAIPYPMRYYPQQVQQVPQMQQMQQNTENK